MSFVARIEIKFEEDWARATVAEIVERIVRGVEGIHVVSSVTVERQIPKMTLHRQGIEVEV